MAYEFQHKRAETFGDYLLRHMEWGWHTFGAPADGRGPLGPLDHIKKELKEIEEDPSDLKEWIDLIILSIDGMLRAGASPGAVLMLYPEPYSHGKEIYPTEAMEDVIDYVHIPLTATPDSVPMWAGMVVSAIGGFLASGGKQTDVLPMLFAKQTKNSLRNWPEWRGSDPTKAIEHVRGHHD